MAEIKITNLVKFYTILLLSDGPKHGYEIIKETGDKLGKRASSGEIYPFLKKLEKQKLIKSKEVGERDKKVFYLTQAGKKFVENMLNKFSNLLDIAVGKKITTCPHCSCKIYGGGHKERIKGKELVFCCHNCANSYKSTLHR